MRLWVTGDFDWDSRIHRILDYYTDGKDHFLEKNYGVEVCSVDVIFVCRQPGHNFKRRVMLNRKQQEFYTDIMLDLPTIIPLSMKEKMIYVSREFHDQLSEQLNKRKFKDFDHIRFLADLREWLNGIEERYDGHTTGAWHY